MRVLKKINTKGQSRINQLTEDNGGTKELTNKLAAYQLSDMNNLDFRSFITNLFSQFEH